MQPGLRCWVLLLSLLWMSTAFGAQSSAVQADHLTVQLVSRDARAVPGTTTLLGIRLEHEPH